jgi:LacI family transcriptional regulator
MPVMSGVSDALVDEGIAVFMSNIEDGPGTGQAHLEALLDKQVDGIIVTGNWINRRLPIDLSEVGMLVIYVFTDAPDDAVTVVSDDRQGAQEVCWHHDKTV